MVLDLLANQEQSMACYIIMIEMSAYGAGS